MSLPLTRQDLTDEENRRDCLAQLIKCRRLEPVENARTIFGWLETWGDGLEALLADAPNGDEDKEELDRAYQDAQRAEDRTLILSGAIENAVSALDDLPDLPTQSQIEVITSALEKALTE